MQNYVASVTFDNVAVVQTQNSTVAKYQDGVVVTLNKDNSFITAADGKQHQLNGNIFGIYADQHKDMTNILRTYNNSATQDNEAVTLYKDGNVVNTVYADDTVHQSAKMTRLTR